MKYINIVTGMELVTTSRISAPNFVLVDEAKPEKKEEVKETKEVPKRKGAQRNEYSIRNSK